LDTVLTVSTLYNGIMQKLIPQVINGTLFSQKSGRLSFTMISTFKARKKKERSRNRSSVKRH